MDHAKKMVLVPYNMLNTIQQNQREQNTPIRNSMVTLSGEMNNILDDRAESDTDKAKAYTQSLQRYLAFKEKQDEKPLSVRVLHSNNVGREREDVNEDKPPSEIEEEIVQSAPIGMRNKAKLLLRKLKGNKEIINWDEKGEVSVDGNPIRGSNIVDLTLDTLRQRKHFNPEGWQQFRRVLSDLNVPRDYIRNPARKATIARDLDQGESSTITSEQIQSSSTALPPPSPPSRPRLPAKRPAVTMTFSPKQVATVRRSVRKPRRKQWLSL